MAKSLSILFVTGEVLPFVKVGGLADVSYSFPLAVRDIGHDIRVALPKYGSVSERKNRIHEINRLKDMPISLGKTADLATVKSSSLNNPRVKVQAYIATSSKYFDAKKGIYGNPKTGEFYADNDDRFMFFARTVIETCIMLGWYPDVIHCNDWSTALVPALARELFPDKFAKTKFVFTIHNFSEQGVFPSSSFAKTGLPKTVQSNFIHKNNFNFLKAGIVYSDYVTTVSKSYAEEIINQKKSGDSLSAVLSERANKFRGVLNGIDNWNWNPSKDTIIKKKFGSDFYDYKQVNKERLMEACGLEYTEKEPVLGMISKLTSQKGIKLFLDTADRILKENVKLVFLGDGETELKASMKKLAKKYPRKVSVTIGFDDEFAHLIEAGSEIFLMPSLFEPCGLNAMYSLAYGSVPVVSETGGLKDIVKNYDAKTKKGNGFVFNQYNSDGFFAAIKKALELYKDKKSWEAIVHAGMSGNYSWKESVEQYNEIYNLILKS